MEPHRPRSRLLVLTRKETQSWHSPFSAELRRWKRAKILKRCRRLAREWGSREFVLYDAFETRLVCESVLY